MHVYQQDVGRLREKSNVLQNEQVGDVDAILCATGWRPSYETFIDNDLADDLGLPAQIDLNAADKEENHWNRLDSAAEAEITQLFPRLRHPPPYNNIKPPTNLYPSDSTATSPHQQRKVPRHRLPRPHRHGQQLPRLRSPGPLSGRLSIRRRTHRQLARSVEYGEKCRSEAEVVSKTVLIEGSTGTLASS